MSKKTISFQTPPKDPAAVPAPKKRAVTRTRKAAAIDEWVHESDEAAQEFSAGREISAAPEKPAPSEISSPAIESVVAPKAAVAATLSLSAQPDAFEAFKILFLLPYLACFYWSFGAAQKNLRLWPR